MFYIAGTWVQRFSQNILRFYVSYYGVIYFDKAFNHICAFSLDRNEVGDAGVMHLSNVLSETATVTKLKYCVVHEWWFSNGALWFSNNVMSPVWKIPQSDMWLICSSRSAVALSAILFVYVFNLRLSFVQNLKSWSYFAPHSFTFCFRTVCHTHAKKSPCHQFVPYITMSIQLFFSSITIF